MKKILIFIAIVLFLSWVELKSTEDSVTGGKVRSVLNEIHESFK